ncbi:aldolase/citrate lyase family protein [Planctomycetaceae bacterium SH139]
MLITNVPHVARCGVREGVDRVFVDLEIHEKVARQGHLNTVISRHTLADVRAVRQAVPDAELLVRVNPLYAKSDLEIDTVLDAGADLLMLPMFHSAATVAEFSALVAGRAGIIPLVETPQAARQIEQVAAVDGLSEIFIGLNDLHLGLGKRFMFELLADGTVERLGQAIKAGGLPFGFGGIARVGEGLLPAELVLGEHLRLGSQSVILSRTFFHDSSRTAADGDFAGAIAAVRKTLQQLAQRSPQDIRENQSRVATITANIAQSRIPQAA